MAGIFNLVTKLFGNKYAKDIKSIEPIVKQIHAEHEKITAISNDELRSKTIELKAKIEESIFSEKKEMLGCMSLCRSGDANSIGNRLLAYTGIIPEIKLPDRVQLATKLEHFVGSLPLIPGKGNINELSKGFVQ